MQSGYDRQTSGAAFSDVMSDKKRLAASQKRVLATIIALQPCNDRMIAERLNLPINTITPRRGELLDSGLIRLSMKALDVKTKRKTSYYEVSIPDQLELF